MYKQYRAIATVVMVLLPALLMAQFNNNTTSPYSRFALGDLQGSAFGRTVSMGGQAFGSRNSLQINIANPASYTSTDSLAFLFEFGLNGRLSQYKNELGDFEANDVNFSYFAMSFPISRRFSGAMGLTPYSDVGYDVQVNQELPYSGPVRYLYFGEGSISRAFVGLAARPLKNVSVGANFYYLFGNLNRSANITFPLNADMYGIVRTDALRLRDWGIQYGLQATLPMKKERSLTIGVTLDNQPVFTGFNSEISFKSLVLSDASGNRIGDADTLSYRQEEKDKIVMPLAVGAGISFVQTNKFELVADYAFQQWSKATFFGEPYFFVTDRTILSLGGEYIPDRFSIRSYASRLAYRAGVRYENGYLLINNHQISEVGITFGVGLPVYRSFSTVNLSAEIGRRGTTRHDLVRENYVKFNFSLNLHDFWFVKRRFD